MQFGSVSGTSLRRWSAAGLLLALSKSKYLKFELFCREKGLVNLGERDFGAFGTYWHFLALLAVKEWRLPWLRWNMETEFGEASSLGASR
jgi:hypothetical protein